MTDCDVVGAVELVRMASTSERVSSSESDPSLCMLLISAVSSMNRSLLPDNRHHFCDSENSYCGSPRCLTLSPASLREVVYISNGETGRG